MIRGLLLAVVAMLAGFASADEPTPRPTPFIEGEYDALVIVETADATFRRIYFVRAGRVVASRVLDDTMVWSIRGDGFCLTWSDYGEYDRAIWFRSLVVTDWECESPDDAPWWAMNRRMTDLEILPK